MSVDYMLVLVFSSAFLFLVNGADGHSATATVFVVAAVVLSPFRTEPAFWVQTT